LINHLKSKKKERLPLQTKAQQLIEKYRKRCTKLFNFKKTLAIGFLTVRSFDSTLCVGLLERENINPIVG
jgi:hypothetical protein